MNKYRSGSIYFGNLMKYENGRSKIFKSNVCFVYYEDTDTFCSLDDTLTYHIDLLNINLSDIEREEYQRKIREYHYTYFHNGKNGEIYVDENSLVPILNGKKNR